MQQLNPIWMLLVKIINKLVKELRDFKSLNSFFTVQEYVPIGAKIMVQMILCSTIASLVLMKSA